MCNRLLLLSFIALIIIPKVIKNQKVANSFLFLILAFLLNRDTDKNKPSKEYITEDNPQVGISYGLKTKDVKTAIK